MPQADVVVVGAGPAGLAAAIALRRDSRLHVVVLEREATAGGIPRHCGHYPFGLREYRRLLRGPDYAARLVAEARSAGVEIRCSTAVSALQRGPVLEASDDALGLHYWQARAVLLATGVRETSRAARWIGGTKPAGVVSTAALQSAVYLHRHRPFLKPVVLGTELVSFSALLTCRHAGAKPVAMIEAGERIVARRPVSLLAGVLGVPIRYHTHLVEIHGRDQVSAVTVQSETGQTEVLSCDGVIVSGGFIPESSLLQGSHLERDEHSGGPEIDAFGRCSDPWYFAAGNVLRGVETAGWCWEEGRRVAQSIRRALSGDLPQRVGSCVQWEDPILRYVVPAFWLTNAFGGHQDAAGAAHRTLQWRVSRTFKGEVELWADGRCVAKQAVHARPERRLLLQVPAIRAERLEIRLREASVGP